MSKKKLLATQNNANVENGEKTIERESINGTPFMAVKDNGKWMIVVGSFIVSGEKFSELKEVLKYIESKPWELIINAVTAYNQTLKNLKIENYGN